MADLWENISESEMRKVEIYVKKLGKLCRVIDKTTPVYYNLKEQLESIEHRVQSLRARGRLHAIPILEVRASAIEGVMNTYKHYLEAHLAVREEIVEFLEPYA